MKKLSVVLSFIAVMFLFMTGVRAADAYYNISFEQSEWLRKSDGGYNINKTFYVEKTINGYVYINFIETNNVNITGEMAGSKFEIVNKEETDDGVIYLLKVKDGSSVSGKTEILTITADIVDSSKKECQLDYSPLGLSCAVVANHYFDKDSKEVSEEEQKASCEGAPVEDPTPPDDPNDVPTPDTGSVIPYIAVGGGLVAIAGVYLYSRKTNKVYKI